MRIISVTGAIGSGKTTLLRRLRERNARWRVVEEPVAEWERDGWLSAFYADKPRWAFPFQMKVVQSQIEAIEANSDAEVLIIERSPLDGLLVFCQLLCEQGAMPREQYDVYRFFVERLWKPSALVLLDVPPDQLLQRIAARNRAAECSASDAAYFGAVAEKYARLAQLPLPTLVLAPYNLAQLDEQCARIEAFVESH
jgi:deoxyadenosine/deoxycytidine kinase